MLEGEASEAPAEPQYSQTWQHGQPDLILSVELPYTLPAGGTDVFRNFILPYPLKQTHYIRAMEIRPSVPQIVHHANVLIDRTASYRRTHPDNWQGGIPGMELAVDAGNRFDPDSSFLFWKPDTPFLSEPPVDAVEARSRQRSHPQHAPEAFREAGDGIGAGRALLHRDAAYQAADAVAAGARQCTRHPRRRRKLRGRRFARAPCGR